MYQGLPTCPCISLVRRKGLGARWWDSVLTLHSFLGWSWFGSNITSNWLHIVSPVYSRLLTRSYAIHIRMWVEPALQTGIDNLCKQLAPVCKWIILLLKLSIFMCTLILQICVVVWHCARILMTCFSTVLHNLIWRSAFASVLTVKNLLEWLLGSLNKSNNVMQWCKKGFFHSWLSS